MGAGSGNAGSGARGGGPAPRHCATATGAKVVICISAMRHVPARLMRTRLCRPRCSPGAVGLVAFALASAWAVYRFKGLVGSLVSLLPWVVASLAAYLFLMGAR